ncbi:hypothetical protein [Methanohalobium sp.]|uniref:hypothetical protein n=1 Tax=Methanohalobium sp. TaxID=2837493 RepID=UPI0025DC801B|nr:hypothetical protein [Methanohalobium sp.]
MKKLVVTNDNQLDKKRNPKQICHMVVCGRTKKKLDKEDRELYDFMVGGLQAK